MSEQTAVRNANQREEWNSVAGSRWLERHVAIDKQIAPFGHRAMDRAGIEPGQHVLDVGCGCGETTFDLAHRVGMSGLAVGVDISQLLIEVARKSAQHSGISNIRFEEADAQTCTFRAGSFDVAFSRFGVMFFDDPNAAFRNIRSALRRDGCLSFVCWPAPSENLFVTIPMAAAARHITLPARGEPDAPGPFAFADINRVHGILSGSEFRDIEVERITEKVGGGSLDETTDLLLQIVPIGELLSGLDEETQRAVRTDIRSELRQFEQSGRALFDAVAWLVTARS